MRKINNLKLLFAVVAVSLLVAGSAMAGNENINIASYCIGYDTGLKIGETPNLVDSKTFVQGFEDYSNNKEPKYSQEEITQAAQDVNKFVTEKLGDSAQQPTPEMIKAIDLPSDIKEVLSYGSGFMYGVQLSEGDGIFDSAEIMKGLSEAAAGKKNPYTEEQKMAAMASLEKLFQQKMEEKMSEVAKPNIEAGKKYMEEYVKQDGVKVTPEGIAYKVIKSGTGKSPKATDVVKVHYAGRLIDGAEFDSSIKRNEPMEFPLQGVVDGWKAILPQMKVGDKWEIVLPYDLGYGLQGQPYGQVPIKPGDTLIFEIELLDVK